MEDDEEDEDDYDDIDLDDEETSLDTSLNDDSWVRPAPRQVSSSLRSHYHKKHHRVVEPTTSSPSISYGTPSKESTAPKAKKSLSLSLRSRFSSKKKQNRPRDIKSVANGLKLAQTQAIAVAGFLADVDAKVYDTCFSHRASYHGRGGSK